MNMPEVQVTNGNKFTLKGRFAGQDYIFEPNRPVSIPEKAAFHIFALGLEPKEKTGALNRLGLLKPDGTLEEAIAALNKVTFVAGHVVFGESQSLPPPKEEPQPIGDSPGAPRSPGGESAADAELPSPVSAADALAREILHRRQKKPGG